MSKKIILHADYFVKWSDGTGAKIGGLDISANGINGYQFHSKGNVRFMVGWELVKKGFRIMFTKKEDALEHEEEDGRDEDGSCDIES